MQKHSREWGNEGAGDQENWVMTVAAGDDFPIIGIDYIEFYVGNARQAVSYHRAWGFQAIAYLGLETGSRDRVSWCLEQQGVRLVLTASLTPDTEIAAHVKRHGDGVHDVALRVPDAKQAYRVALAGGATAIAEPQDLKDDFGTVTRCAITTYGDTIHSLVSREDYQGAFLPGYQAAQTNLAKSPVGIRNVDHVVGCVELGDMEETVASYRKVMGFEELHHFSDEQVSTEYSALMSKVVCDGTGRVKFPICEPTQGKRKSQIQEFLDFYGSPGVQHVALEVDDIVRSVGVLRDAGVEFLSVPREYYANVEHRVQEVAWQVDDLAKNGILVDKDEDGYLLQIFTKPTGDRPTFFYELIERHGSKGFGAGNFKALFEALEREQAVRGNL